MGIITITIPKRRPKPSGGVIIRARSTQDAFSLASLYEDLANRLAQAWVDLTEGEGATKDEKAGHEFHGNQYVEVPGSPKPTTTVAKIAKHAVHELLSSGHPFTIEELGAITGHANPKTLAAWLTMFKSPKYAGPKGVLDIKKLPDGSYQVVKPDGTPAPANPKLAEVKEANKKIKEEHGDLSEMKPPKGYVPTQVKPPPSVVEPSPEEELSNAIKQANPDVESVHHVKGGAITVPKTPKTKEEADSLYYGSMVASQHELADEIGSTPPEKYEEMLLAFKQEKALFMAQWKTNTTGKFHEPKPQDQVFKADKMLIDDLVKVSGSFDLNDSPDEYGMAVIEAFSAWKKNTKLEKMGLLGKAPDPIPNIIEPDEPKVAPVAPPIPGLKPTDVQPLPYHALVPTHHEPIGEQDFTAPHAAKTKFSQEIENLKKQLEIESKTAQANKATVEKRLRARLANAPNFSKLVALHESGGDIKAFNALLASTGKAPVKTGINSLESKLVATWAGSSGGMNPLSNAMQLAVQEAFSIPEDHVTKQQLHVVQKLGNSKKVYIEGAKKLGLTLPGSPGSTQHEEHLEVFRKGLQEFAHAQYHETQELLKSKGIDHVYLARGMKFNSADHKKILGGPVHLKLQPASSFSTNVKTAYGFAGGGTNTIFIAKVPREQILSTYLTGFGCTNEHEVVVLAHEKLKSYGVEAAGIDDSSDVAATVMHKLKQAKSTAPKNPGTL